MPPTHPPSPKPKGTGTETPRLDINDNGVAKAVFPQGGVTEHRERMEEIKAGRLATEEGSGSGQVAAPPFGKNKHLGPFPGPTPMDAVHLGVGRHQESYLRTRPVEPAGPAGPVRAQGETIVIDDETDDENDQAETAGIMAVLQAPDLAPIPAPWQLLAGPPPLVEENMEETLLKECPFLRDTHMLYLLARAGAIRASDYDQAYARGEIAYPLTIVHENAEELAVGVPVIPTYPGLPPIEVTWRPSNIPQHLELFGGGARPQPDLMQRRHLEERLERDYHRQVLRREIVAEPVIPSVVFMKLADKHTRLRHSAEILTIKGEKYVRLDETHFLYAVNVEYLLEGDDVTIRRRAYIDWPPHVNHPELVGRAPRPEVLFELYPIGEYEYTPENGRRKKAPQEFRPQCDIFGRVILNAEDRPLRFSLDMPYRVSTEIEGWEMEALCRIDPDLCHQDFIDRMLPDTALNGKARPAKGTLNQRRRRDRMRMRVLPWPVPAELGYSDQQIIKQLNGRQIESNTTLGLRDLSKEEIEMQEAIMYGSRFERSGVNNALNDDARLEQFQTNLALVRTKFAEDSEEVKMVKERVVALLTKLGRGYDPAVWDVGVKA